MRRLLLVEDSAADVELFREALADGEPETQLDVVGDGEEALDFLHRHGSHSSALVPDLMVLDLNMPRLSGFEVLDALKDDADPVLRRLPVVVFTTSRTLTDVQRAYDLKAASYITKPSDFHEYLDAVGHIQDFWFRVSTLPNA